MGEWVRAQDFLTHGHAVRKVGGLNPRHGVVGIFLSNHATGKVFSAKNDIYCKL